MNRLEKCIICGDSHFDSIGDSVCVNCRNPNDYLKDSKGRGHLAYTLAYCTKHGYDNIMDVALNVRMNSNGSSESSIKDISLDVSCLEYVLKTWKPSLRKEDEAFDIAVYNVCKEALKAINKSFLRKFINEFRTHKCETAEYMNGRCVHCGKFIKE